MQVMTTLDLLRHGEARGAAAGGDAARPLTLHGTQAVERLGRHLASLGWRPALAFASPLLRARQTAALVLLSAQVPLTPEPLAELAPDAEPSELLTVLAGLGVADTHVLLVGHQPLLGDLVTWCTGGDAAAITPGQLVRIMFAGAPARGGGAVSLALRPEAM